MYTGKRTSQRKRASRGKRASKGKRSSRGRSSGTKSNRKKSCGKITRNNWMKKLIFKGGDASHHATNVYGSSGQQFAGADNSIQQHPVGGVQTPVEHAQSGGKKKRK
jgi:hypothetical protein